MVVNVARNFPRKLKQPAWFLPLSIDPQLRPQSEIVGGYVQQDGFFLFSFETFQDQTGMAKSFWYGLAENFFLCYISLTCNLVICAAPSLAILQRSWVGQSPYHAPAPPPPEKKRNSVWVIASAWYLFFDLFPFISKRVTVIQSCQLKILIALIQSGLISLDLANLTFYFDFAHSVFFFFNHF